MFRHMTVGRWTLVALVLIALVVNLVRPSPVTAAAISILFVVTFAWRLRQHLTGHRG